MQGRMPFALPRSLRSMAGVSTNEAVALYATYHRGGRARRGAEAIPGAGWRRPPGRTLSPELRSADRRHGETGLRVVPAARNPGADHHDLARAGRSKVRFQR